MVFVSLGDSGALLQFIGGSKRQIGVLFATGLLISFPAAGWAVPQVLSFGLCGQE